MKCWQCYPHYWLLGFSRYGRKWIHYHRWQPNCRKLYRNLQRLENENGNKLRKSFGSGTENR
jgi:hypothetical protein